jgi:hypothetical protein
MPDSVPIIPHVRFDLIISVCVCKLTKRAKDITIPCFGGSEPLSGLDGLDQRENIKVGRDVIGVYGGFDERIRRCNFDRTTYMCVVVKDNFIECTRRTCVRWGK